MVLSPRHQYLFSPQYFDTRTMSHHWGTSPWVELETHLREVWSCLITGKTPNVASHRSSLLYITWGFCTTSAVVNFTVLLLIVESYTQLISWLYKFAFPALSLSRRQMSEVRPSSDWQGWVRQEAGPSSRRAVATWGVISSRVTCHIALPCLSCDHWPPRVDQDWH